VFFALMTAPLVWWLCRRRAGSASEVSSPDERLRSAR